MKVKVGDWVIITGANSIGQQKYDETFPQGRFGKVIEIQKRYSPFTGEKRPDTVIVRVYAKGEKYHTKTYYSYLKKWNDSLLVTK